MGLIWWSQPVAHTFPTLHTCCVRSLLRACWVLGRPDSYGFGLDENLVAAARDSSVRSALSTKVSRERFGIEVKKMLEVRVLQTLTADWVRRLD